MSLVASPSSPMLNCASTPEAAGACVVAGGVSAVEGVAVCAKPVIGITKAVQSGRIVRYLFMLVPNPLNFTLITMLNQRCQARSQQNPTVSGKFLLITTSPDP
jgi:hypothetical protein